jgi:hypothetical protein
VEIAVVIRISRHGWTGYRCHHSVDFVVVVVVIIHESIFPFC